MHDLAVHGDRFHSPVGFFEDGTAGGFIDAAAFHADVAVFHQVDAANAVLAAQLIELGHEVGRRQMFAVHRHGITFFKLNLYKLRLIRGIFRPYAKHVHFLRCLGPGVLQNIPFKRDVEQVAVGTPGELFAGRNRNAVFFGVFFQGGTALHVPLTPGSDDLDGGIKMVISDFKTHLIIALAGGTMGNGVCPFPGGNLHLRLGDQRTGNGSAEEVASLVDSVGPKHGKDEIAGKFFLQIDNVTGRGAGIPGFFRNMIQLFTLPEIGAVSNNLAAVLLYQPFENNGGVKPS